MKKINKKLIYILIFLTQLQVLSAQSIQMSIKVPSDYELSIKTRYHSYSNLCQGWDYMATGPKSGSKDVKSTLEHKNNTFYTEIDKSYNSIFCNWDISNIKLSLVLKENKKNSKLVKEPFEILLRGTALKSGTPTINEKFIFLRSDRYKTIEKNGAKNRIIKTNLIVRSKNLKPMNLDEGVLSIDGFSNTLTKINLDFKTKDDIYCFVRGSDCPTYSKRSTMSDVKYLIKTVHTTKESK